MHMRLSSGPGLRHWGYEARTRARARARARARVSAEARP